VKYRNICLLMVLFFVGQLRMAEAHTVRGRIDRQLTMVPAPGAPPMQVWYPAPQVKVQLFGMSGASAPTYTDQGGIFYIYNVPAGTSFLVVTPPRGRSRNVEVQVLSQPVTDLAPIDMSF
jgi:hypothetical protein